MSNEGATCITLCCLIGIFFIVVYPIWHVIDIIRIRNLEFSILQQSIKLNNKLDNLNKTNNFDVTQYHPNTTHKNVTSLEELLRTLE